MCRAWFRRSRLVPLVGKAEHESVPTIIAKVDPSSTVFTDELSDYKGLRGLLLKKTIDHSVGYSIPEEGISTNQVESCHARTRRSEIGIHHHIAGPHLLQYAGEMSWREDRRRISNGEQFLLIGVAALHHPVSKRWKGYWQRGKWFSRKKRREAMAPAMS